MSDVADSEKPKWPEKGPGQWPKDIKVRVQFQSPMARARPGIDRESEIREEVDRANFLYRGLLSCILYTVMNYVVNRVRSN